MSGVWELSFYKLTTSIGTLFLNFKLSSFHFPIQALPKTNRVSLYLV